MQIVVVDDAAAAASLAADMVARRIRSAVRLRGSACIAVSGGTTPAAMLAHLAQMDLPWPAVTVLQVDERVAPDGDPDRNVTMLSALSSTAAHVLPMPVTAADLRRAAARYASRLPDRIDVVHLGMGADGHTASWPPGDPVIDALARVAMSGPYQERVRMTLTPPVVNAARFRLVLATGGSKRPPLQRWLAGDRTLPISRVRRTGTVLVVDAEAAPATDR
jgi:6-phosphogluconolactonase